MSEFDVVILTDSRYLRDSTDPYKHNVFYEDLLVANGLKRLGLKVTRVAWDNKSFHWSKSKSLLFRSTWDYFDRFEEFSAWLKKVSKIAQLINSEDLIRWNIDKHYLMDLMDNGIHIPESQFIEIGSKITLKELHQSLGWIETVLKPCVSGAARHTYRLNTDNLEHHEEIFKKLIKNESMLLQPFQHNIVSEGELSLMVIKGKFTHAVLKKAKKDDFRVQDDFGGTVHDYFPTQEEIKFAEHAVTGCPELPVYARVDIFKDNNQQLAVSELELIEPELWFRNNPTAADALAIAIKEKLSKNT